MLQHVKADFHFESAGHRIVSMRAAIAGGDRCCQYIRRFTVGQEPVTPLVTYSLFRPSLEKAPFQLVAPSSVRSSGDEAIRLAPVARQRGDIHDFHRDEEDHELRTRGGSCRR